MDEAKRKELEELRKQIDPKILERVANSMGKSTGGGGGGGGGASAPSSAPPARRRGGGGSGMSDLKARIARREKELEKWEEDQEQREKEAEAARLKAEQRKAELERLAETFVIFDTNMMRSRQLLAYLQRMEFQRLEITGDPKRFFTAYLGMLNNPEIKHPAIITSVEGFPMIKAMINSEELAKIRSRLPKLGYTPIFVLYDDDKALMKLQDVDPRYVMNMRHDPKFNRKRIVQVLDLLHPAD